MSAESDVAYQVTCLGRVALQGRPSRDGAYSHSDAGADASRYHSRGRPGEGGDGDRACELSQGGRRGHQRIVGLFCKRSRGG